MSQKDTPLSVSLRTLKSRSPALVLSPPLTIGLALIAQLSKVSCLIQLCCAYIYKKLGNVCYDFMTNNIKGDSTSTSSRELMLWLQYEGGQLPIGWGKGPSATIDDLFGTSWELYEDVNSDTGITVSSMLPTTQFEGSFSGDLKDWLLALVALGKFTEDTYVNVGNAGTEFFYGNAIMNATLALQIDIRSTSH